MNSWEIKIYLNIKSCLIWWGNGQRMDLVYIKLCLEEFVQSYLKLHLCGLLLNGSLHFRTSNMKLFQLLNNKPQTQAISKYLDQVKINCISKFIKPYNKQVWFKPSNIQSLMFKNTLILEFKKKIRLTK